MRHCEIDVSSIEIASPLSILLHSGQQKLYFVDLNFISPTDVFRSINLILQLLNSSIAYINSGNILLRKFVF